MNAFELITHWGCEDKRHVILTGIGFLTLLDAVICIPAIALNNTQVPATPEDSAAVTAAVRKALLLLPFAIFFLVLLFRSISKANRTARDLAAKEPSEYTWSEKSRRSTERYSYSVTTRDTAITGKVKAPQCSRASSAAGKKRKDGFRIKKMP